jgi:hypothetical protein
VSVVAPDPLDWRGFCAAYFPGRRRHDFEALIAYGAYRRSLDEPPADRAREADRRAGNSSAIEVWEDEGGPVA